MKNKTYNQEIRILMNDELKNKLEKEAYGHGLSVAGLIRLIVIERFEKNEPSKI